MRPTSLRHGKGTPLAEIGGHQFYAPSGAVTQAKIDAIPAVAGLDGNLLIEIKSEVEDELRDALAGLKPEEAAVLGMLRSRLAKEVAAKSGPIGETTHAA